MTLPLQAESEEGTDAPLDVMHGEVVLVADVGEIEHHRQSEELVAPLVYHRSTTSDDGFGEVVVQWDTGVAEGHGCVAVDDERGQC